ncbi:alpha/beta fold hydrolase [Nocardia niigatensis]|uniref:alpha/beta fold hydrolase n=1 Tax=Nocardia niigatensis TaxID=209249 RepID=UPI0002F4C937|nr:alpha/beta fold hydrolase [Nocardia niigatensis]
MSLADTVTTAARNMWALTFGDGIETPEPTPSTVLSEAPHRELRRYDGAGPDDPAVLLVPPLAAPAFCFDLRPDQSLARFLLDTGRAPFLVDYGDITFDDRRMGFESWIDDILPEAIRQVSADRGGRPVDLVGWSIGGVLSLLTAAADQTLPIRSVTAVGAPLSYARMFGARELRVLSRVEGGLATTTAIRALGGVPAQMTRIAYRATAWDRELKRPYFIASNLADTATLARMETIDRFQNSLPGYPGRFYNQLFGRLLLNDDIGKGGLRLGDREIALADITQPVLLVGGPNDAITPAGAVKHGTTTLTGSTDVRYETAPGSHLGILIARDTTWTYLDKFLRDQP